MNKAMTKIEELETELWHEKALRGAWQEAASRVRNGTIEECARVAENIFVTDSLEHRLVDQVAAAIRALKDTTKEE